LLHLLKAPSFEQTVFGDSAFSQFYNTQFKLNQIIQKYLQMCKLIFFRYFSTLNFRVKVPVWQLVAGAKPIVAQITNPSRKQLLLTVMLADILSMFLLPVVTTSSL
jgi:hypothetical protein